MTFRPYGSERFHGDGPIATCDGDMRGRDTITSAIWWWKGQTSLTLCCSRLYCGCDTIWPHMSTHTHSIYMLISSVCVCGSTYYQSRSLQTQQSCRTWRFGADALFSSDINEIDSKSFLHTQQHSSPPSLVLSHINLGPVYKRPEWAPSPHNHCYSAQKNWINE